MDTCPTSSLRPVSGLAAMVFATLRAWSGHRGASRWVVLAAALVLISHMPMSAAEQDTVSIDTVNAEIREPDNGTGDQAFTEAFRISRGVGQTGDLRVNLAIAEYPNRGDYTLTLADETTVVSGPSAQITIPHGTTTITLKLAPRDNQTIEGHRLVTVTIAPADATSDSYLRSPAFETSTVIADNDLVLGWSIIANQASEAFMNASPPEGAVRLSFFDVDGHTLDGADLVAAGMPDVHVAFRLLDGSGQATLNTDYLLTQMYRHTGSAGSSILFGRSVGFDAATETWTGTPLVKVTASAGKDATLIIISDIGTLTRGDVIAFGTEAVNLYTIEHVIGATQIEVSPPLKAAVDADTLVRNNIEVPITTNGDILGMTMSSTYNQIDLAITPKHDTEAEGAESVTMQLLSSPDYIVRSPNNVELSIADINILAWIEAVDDANRSTHNVGTLRVHLSSPAPRALALPITVATGTGYAVPGTDYADLPSSITIPAGSSTFDIEIVPLLGSGVDAVQVSLVDTSDIILAGDGPSKGQTATVFVRDGAGVTSSGLVTVRSLVATTADDVADAAPAVFAVEVARAGNSNPVITIPLLVGGTAIPAVDYASLRDSVVLPRLVVGSPVGSDAAFISLRTESGSVELPAGTPLRIGTGSTVRTVATTTTVQEIAAYVTLTQPIGALVVSGTTVGVNRVLIPVVPVQDSFAEGSETVTLALMSTSTADNYTLGTPATATIAIAEGTSSGGGTNSFTPGAINDSGCGQGSSAALVMLMVTLGLCAMRRRD